MTTANEVLCRACGSNLIVDGACVACGKGVSYRLPFHRGPKKVRAHKKHEWGFVGITFETGTRARKERCTKGRCVATRIVEVGE